MARIEVAAELPTVWETPDDLWEQFIVPLLREHDPEPRTGRPRTDQRKALDGIIFILPKQILSDYSTSFGSLLLVYRVI